MMDSGTANGSDSQELTRVQNFYAGSNENTNVTQAAPTSRATQKTAGRRNAAETTSSSGGGGNARTAAAGNGAPPPWWAVPGYSPGDRIGQGATSQREGASHLVRDQRVGRLNRGTGFQSCR